MNHVVDYLRLWPTLVLGRMGRSQIEECTEVGREDGDENRENVIVTAISHDEMEVLRDEGERRGTSKEGNTSRTNGVKHDKIRA